MHVWTLLCLQPSTHPRTLPDGQACKGPCRLGGKRCLLLPCRPLEMRSGSPCLPLATGSQRQLLLRLRKNRAVHQPAWHRGHSQLWCSWAPHQTCSQSPHIIPQRNSRCTAGIQQGPSQERRSPSQRLHLALRIVLMLAWSLGAKTAPWVVPKLALRPSWVISSPCSSHVPSPCYPAAPPCSKESRTLTTESAHKTAGEFCLNSVGTFSTNQDEL
mmetsp:Transcript_5332/g.15279  ORF Transcript_5332/g.15279 Transcript_5332/m.15279 type:complete len:215 (+) Transcript_5332:3675-4319(+)